MQLATLNAEALAGLLTIDVGFADLPSGCSDERARLITGTVLALLLLAAWYPARRFLRGVSTGDARLIAAILSATLLFFLGDAWFTFWSLTDCLGDGTGDGGTPDWWALFPAGVVVGGMWKSGVFDGEEPAGEESGGIGSEGEE